MEKEKLDHLTVMPYIPYQSFSWPPVMTSKFLFVMSGRPWMNIDKRPLKCARGIGPFNLVRKSFFDQTEALNGLNWTY